MKISWRLVNIIIQDFVKLVFGMAIVFLGVFAVYQMAEFIKRLFE